MPKKIAGILCRPSKNTPMESTNSNYNSSFKNSGHQQTQTHCFVVVARHGERLDYVSREVGVNWTAQAECPYDPPLTDHGKEQAVKLGRHLATNSELVKYLDLPPISCIYTSPFLRCIQTSLSAQKGMMQMQMQSISDEEAPSSNGAVPPPVRVEFGLAESINEAWYRSWPLPGSDGSWAFQRNSVQTLLDDCWKRQQQAQQADNGDEFGRIDLSHISKTQIESPYSFHPRLWESRKQQRRRMKQTMDALAGGPGTTVLLVTHGGPATHLFEEVTGQPWSVHGDSVYCCYSIYKRSTTTTTTKNPGDNNDETCSSSLSWTLIRVNQFEYLNESDLHGDSYVNNNTT